MHHKDLTTFTPIEQVKDLMRQPPGPWPEGWVGFPNVIQAFKEMFDEAAHNIPGPPLWQADRGIVICGGGWRFFASIYVTVRMIRRVGCTLPIQIWYLGDSKEFDIRMLWALEPYDVGWIDANAFSRDNKVPHRTLGGWTLKPFASAFAPYREVIALDADCYPVYNPEEFLAHPEYQRVRAAFWPDQAQLEPGQWDRFGVARHSEPAWESGQYIVDKGRHWAPLWLTYWMNNYSDYVYSHIYGDKDTFHLCWRKTGYEVCIPWSSPDWHGGHGTFVHKDYSGRILFLHRTRNKFRWNGEIDGHTVPDHYMTSQWLNNHFADGLPFEGEAHAFCLESSQLLRPELHFKVRPDTCDRGMFLEVWLQNEYSLPPRFSPDDVIVDIGGHIGAFVQACLSRGAGRVITCEPEKENLELLRANTDSWKDRVTIVPRAVWPFGKKALLSPPEKAYDTCQHSMAFREGGVPVETVPLSDVLALAGGRIRMLKLDCEGAEHYILNGVDLSSVQEIVGESHHTGTFQREDILPVLQGLFSKVTHRVNGPMTLLFRGSR